MLTSHMLQRPARQKMWGSGSSSVSWTRRARLGDHSMVWFTAVKFHDSIDSRRIDMLVSRSDEMHTSKCKVLFQFPSFYKRIFSAIIVLLPHYDEGPINGLLKSPSQACIANPSLERTKRRLDKYRIEWK